MTRFLLVLAKNLKRLEIKPNIIPQPYGDWYTHHPRKGPIDDYNITYSYQELFALPPSQSRSDGKLECGEVEKMVEGVMNGNSMSFEEFINWYSLN